MRKAMSVRGVAVLLIASSFAAFAVDEHGHDHGDSRSVATGPALPRFEATSESFEAVGVLHPRELSVLVDRFADNEPVLNASVSMESGSLRLAGAFRADRGDYRFDSTALSKPGTYPITLTIQTPDAIDILAGNLVVAPPPAATPTAVSTRWPHLVGGAFLLLGALWWALRKRKPAHV